MHLGLAARNYPAVRGNDEDGEAEGRARLRRGGRGKLGGSLGDSRPKGFQVGDPGLERPLPEVRSRLEVGLLGLWWRLSR